MQRPVLPITRADYLAPDWLDISLQNVTCPTPFILTDFD